MNGDNTAIVTGASGGIGAAIAKAMLERGYRVISLALHKPDWSHPRLDFREIDLFDAKATAAAAAEIAREHRVTHVVHNAGVIRPNPSRRRRPAISPHWPSSISVPRCCWSERHCRR